MTSCVQRHSDTTGTQASNANVVCVCGMLATIASTYRIPGIGTQQGSDAAQQDDSVDADGSLWVGLRHVTRTCTHRHTHAIMR